MVRTAGIVLVLLASASIALGSPLCCLVGHGCCRTPAAEAPRAEHDCCSHCKPKQGERPAPCREKKDCACEHDVSPHATSVGHAPVVAVVDVPPVAPPAALVTGTAAPAPRLSSRSRAPLSHPLLL